MSFILRYVPVLTVAALSIVLTACEDPSNVGLGLIGEGDVEPGFRAVPVSEFYNRAPERRSGTARRVLAGAVDDPLTGRVRVDGYVDFAGVATPAFRGGTVESAELRLRPNYVYGDTTGDARFAVRAVEEAWSVFNLPTDTTFPAGDVILEFVFDPTDTLVVVPFPASWVEANDALLRSENFNATFHGFRLEAVNSNAVVGFSATESVFRARTAADSVSFAANVVNSAVFSSFYRLSDPLLPENRLLIQSGAGPGAAIELDFDAADLTGRVVNRFVLTFESDVETLRDQTPAGFVRTVMPTLDLYGITSDGAETPLARSSMDSDGRFVYDSRTFATELQAALLGRRTYERFELRIPAAAAIPDPESELRLLAATLGAALLFDTHSGDRAPSAFLTVTPTDG